MKKIEQKLAERRQSKALRVLADRHDLVDFSSNNYLGLERFLTESTKKNDLNRSGSRLLSGESAYKSSVEKMVAEHHQAEAALIFSSGYSANLGLISCIADKEDTIIYDALSHASIRDGLILSRAKKLKFAHNNLADLERKLQFAEGDVYVVIESVYSMDGDGPDLKKVANICQKYSADLIVDEAHSGGVYGRKGEGLCVEEGIHESVFARIITYGKAFGYHGAAVLGSQGLRDYLINFSRPFIYSTAPSDQFFSGIESRYGVIQARQEILAEFEQKKEFFIQKSEQMGLKLTGGMSGIFISIYPGNEAVRELAQNIQNAGYDVRPILSPTVPTGTERLRICLHATNTEQEIKGLLENLKKYA